MAIHLRGMTCVLQCVLIVISCSANHSEHQKEPCLEQKTAVVEKDLETARNSLLISRGTS